MEIENVISDNYIGVDIIQQNIEPTLEELSKAQNKYFIEQLIAVNVEPDVVFRQQKRINQLEDKLRDVQEKLSPKSPEYKANIREDGYTVNCPNCLTIVPNIIRKDIFTPKPPKPNFCPLCGQALDWRCSKSEKTS